ncbi:MAG: CocE/NonD family hydrolase, partial [Actinomycetota bacterium]|nr:CocE/NonD family hydrolase [Actinomycetota bacterium]MEC9316859.1 CocE/NonD family hydrolase [Actinomycetota bacterium]
DSPPDAFTYDPDDPVPTNGGNLLVLPIGAYDQREVENRPDVLVYTGDILETELEVTGPIKVVLFAESSALDTDFTAKLVDVHPNGYAQNIIDGMIRCRYRHSREQPTLMRPGEITELEIDLWATSHVFLAGHRIRLDISSSNFPRFDRNLNTGGDQARGTTWTVARQKVHHNAQYQSHIMLPVIP